jgi:hypothetical protein
MPPQSATCSAGARQVFQGVKGMQREGNIWDFFLAHAGTDKKAAEALYDLLSPHFKVFLDSRCLLPGDDWDQEIALAQRKSTITIVLVSSQTEKAYYQREEIAAAIDMARRDKEKHRVVPIFLDVRPSTGNEIPYGLRLKHGLSAPDIGGLEEVARRLKTLLQKQFAMPAWQIQKRYEEQVLVEHAVRLVPTEDYRVDGLLGKQERKYVFVGDYAEQRYRTLRQILSNLWMGDAFDRVSNSNTEWLAIVFEIGELNFRRLDLKPATWKAVFRILSDPKRLGCFEASEEEKIKMGLPPRNYYSEDQRYWYGRLTIDERRYTKWGADFFIRSYFGIDWLCFNGSGITYSNRNSSTIPSRVFFVQNVPLSTLNHKIQVLGFPDDDIVLE